MRVLFNIKGKVATVRIFFIKSEGEDLTQKKLGLFPR